MKKKTTKKKKPVKQKIDVVLESLLNLEQQMRELIKYLKYHYPERPEPHPHYWPNIPIPRYDSVTWNDGVK